MKKGKRRKRRKRRKSLSGQGLMNGFFRIIIGFVMFYVIVFNLKDLDPNNLKEFKFELPQLPQMTLDLPKILQTSLGDSQQKEPKKVTMNTDQQVVVHYIDIGQGDSTLIEYKDFDMLIDGGDNNKTDKLFNYLKKQEIDDFEYVVATHMDADHIGGLDDVINTYQVENIIDSGTSKSTKTYKRYQQAYLSKKIKPIEDYDFTIEIDEYFSVKIIETVDNSKDENENSVIVQVTYGNVDYLFTADMEKEVEKEVLSKFTDIEVLKVGHHGSKTSSSDAFLDRVKPEYGVISCGLDNRYGHPHKEILQEYKSRGIPLYRTDLNGTIVVASDGNKISVNKEK